MEQKKSKSGFFLLTIGIIGTVFFGYIINAILEETRDSASSFGDNEDNYSLLVAFAIFLIIAIIGAYKVYNPKKLKNNQNTSLFNEPPRDSNNSNPTNNIINKQLTCNKCNTVIDTSSKFCRHCGIAIAQNKTCSNCKSEIPINYAFCDKCGQSQ